MNDQPDNENPIEEAPAVFEGFDIPESNYYKTPNEWISICARIDNLAELKVVQYVMRHTWGFQEFGILKHISNDEFVRGRWQRSRKTGKMERMDEGTGLTE